MNDVEDGELLASARRGDEGAFALLFARHERAVYRYARYMCGQEAADDIVQETFLVILRQRERVDSPRATLQAYLLGIARHLALKRLTVENAGLDADSSLLEAGQAVVTQELTALDAMTRRETVAAVRAAVDSLPLPYREVVFLCDLQELDYATAAGILGLPIGTVRSRLHRARALLASKLSVGQPLRTRPER